jgi:hypothetical protein
VTLVVIGAGWGRTGTLSTKVALEALGFGPCYHMIEVFRSHPEHRSDWLAAARGEPVDWHRLLAGYGSAVDWPVAAFWRELAAAFPAAKLLLTTRDPERWSDSFESTISAGIPREPPGPEDLGGSMLHEVIVRRSFAGRSSSREELLERYGEHVEEVRAGVEPDRLLVWSVAEGWGPLCAFLGVPEPDQPFPHVNDRADFRRIFLDGGDPTGAPGGGG